ncbi:SDR family oxidoreductase [Siccirubricoccus sp. KC 17139]|uniref:NADP-dependent 3-hydroxy acid dehydrogenase YdfG n=1 Tax=Siccirubricoccus soli TaxID=2899147 RepID=A0ABT1D0Q7_9PROT|nr:SDR family oxidoreductase [Siccirubricoccus soli]MCO6414880.1 SDR family oxidoreductase [Siccirubricoccus soli]MCP2681010.1 SDR family oxidoreductase [Siccirubricoccus soli]
MPTEPSLAVVTGASSGIGAVYADRLAARGHDLILVARRADRLQALAARIAETHGRKADIHVADLADPASLAQTAATLAANPRIEVLVNNAGLAKLAPFGTAPLADSLSQIALNITSLTQLTQALLPGFLARNRGLIINIASVLGLEVLPGSAVYSGTKGFVLNFSRGLQKELAGSGVKVQAVLPAATATEIWDNSGVPLASLDTGMVMTVENMVDAALAGLDQGEAVTIPPLADLGLWQRAEAARLALFEATRTGRPAPR